MDPQANILTTPTHTHTHTRRIRILDWGRERDLWKGRSESICIGLPPKLAVWWYICRGCVEAVRTHYIRVALAHLRTNWF
mmetsp:Transcript_20993/g.37551  ORF Transcript_20993/g.37551 Transcript_20993/m.37551 type:complete len:80 (-) Transcript_20993:586-825(-)